MRNCFILLLSITLLWGTVLGIGLKRCSPIILESDLVVTKKFYINDRYIFVHSGENDSIHIFNIGGKFLRKISGRGKGPGEFLYIADFTLESDQLIVAGSTGGLLSKIVVFGFDGEIQKEYKIDHQIDKILVSAQKIHYTSNDSIHHLKKEKVKKYSHYIYNLYKMGVDAPLFSTPDYSRINPNMEAPYPWFPAPFPRKIITISKKDSLTIFDTGKNDFTAFMKGKKEIIKLKFNIEAKSLTDGDKRVFIEHMESTNRGKIPPKLLKGIKFPDKKPLFSSVINWNSGFGLVVDKKILVIDNEGNKLFTVNIPEKFFSDEEEGIPFMFVKGSYIYRALEGALLKYRVYK